MKKKKELPRKRRRYLKKIIFFSSFFLTIGIVLLLVGFYVVLVKLEKPLYISPLPITPLVQADQGDHLQMQLEDGLRKKHIEYVSIVKENDSYVVTLQDNSKVTFSTQKDIMTQIASLQYILSDLTMEGRAFSTLDLRFDQPVIVIK